MPLIVRKQFRSKEWEIGGDKGEIDQSLYPRGRNKDTKMHRLTLSIKNSHIMPLNCNLK